MLNEFIFLDDFSIPEKSSVEVITLNGKTDSTLDWNDAKKLAQECVVKRKKILWEMDLGLFSSLTHRLLDQPQLMTLSLSLKHFDSTLWKEFQDETAGLILYRSGIAFQNQWSWDEEQNVELHDWLQDVFGDIDTFVSETDIKISEWKQASPYFLALYEEGRRLLHLYCRDAAVAYLENLSNILPSDLDVCVFFESSNVSDPHLLAELLSKDRYDRFVRAVKRGSLAEKLHHNNAKIGICMPPKSFIRPSHHVGYSEAMDELLRRKMPFRVVSEPYLTSDWHGLDQLIIVPAGMASQTFRKLRGFCAAGGTVVVVGEISEELAQLPEVKSFEDFLTSKNGF